MTLATLVALMLSLQPHEHGRHTRFTQRAAAVLMVSSDPDIVALLLTVDLFETTWGRAHTVPFGLVCCVNRARKRLGREPALPDLAQEFLVVWRLAGKQCGAGPTRLYNRFVFYYAGKCTPKPGGVAERLAHREVAYYYRLRRRLRSMP